MALRDLKVPYKNGMPANGSQPLYATSSASLHRSPGALCCIRLAAPIPPCASAQGTQNMSILKASDHITLTSASIIASSSLTLLPPFLLYESLWFY